MKHEDVESYIFTECFVGKVIISRLRKKYKLELRGNGDKWINHLLSLLKDDDLKIELNKDISRYAKSNESADLYSIFATKDMIIKTATPEISVLAEKLNLNEGDLRAYILHDLGIVNKSVKPVMVVDKENSTVPPGVYIKVDEVNPSEIKPVYIQALQMVAGKKIKRTRDKRPEDDDTNKDQIADFLDIEEELFRTYSDTNSIDITAAINNVVDRRLGNSPLGGDAYVKRCSIIEHNRDVIRKRYPNIPSPHKLESIWKLIAS